MNNFKYHEPIVVAEIGCNHAGNLDVAKQMIKIASDCGAKIVKFQKRNPKELLTFQQYNSPHPNPIHSYGKTYGEHREKLEFTIQQHKELFITCCNYGVRYSTSVWDLTSAKEVIENINPTLIKIPSACNNHYKMLDYIFSNYQNKVHISLGMTTQEERYVLNDFLGPNKDRVIMYACTSGYPVPFDQVFLLDILNIRLQFFTSVGFSGHHLGTSVDIAAYVLGAEYIERHFTLDKNSKGSDHSASLEPKDLSALVKNLKDTYISLKYKPPEMTEIEKIQREKLKYKGV